MGVGIAGVNFAANGIADNCKTMETLKGFHRIKNLRISVFTTCFFLQFLIIACSYTPKKETSIIEIDTLESVAVGYRRDLLVYRTTDCEGHDIEYWLNESHDEIVLTDSASLRFFEDWKTKMKSRITKEFSDFHSTWLMAVIYNYSNHADTLCLFSQPYYTQYNHRLVPDTSFFFMINSFLYRNDSIWRSNNGWIYKDPKYNWHFIDVPELKIDVHETDAKFFPDQLVDYYDPLEDDIP